MELKDLKILSADELIQREKLLKKEIFDLRQKSRLGQAEKPASFKGLRKEIAQILTIINERKIQNGKKN